MPTFYKNNAKGFVSPLLYAKARNIDLLIFILLLSMAVRKKILPGKGDLQWLETTLNLLPLRTIKISQNCLSNFG
jgi:hypothetical protein